MKTRISILIDDVKRTSTLQKWIEEEKNKARQSAYDNRKVIYKNELAEELKKLDCILPLWNMFKKLRKKSTDYDALIEVDRKGYITIQLTFPITWEEHHQTTENRQAYIASNKPFGDICCRQPEEIWKVCHERINKVFKGLELIDYGSYNQYGSNPLIRWVDFVKC